jgi:hypothetical protein
MGEVDVAMILRGMRLVAAVALAAAVVWPTAIPVRAATSTVECGQIVAYTAPDPVAATPGSLTIGVLPPWTIAQDAVLSPEIISVLPGFAGSGPSCIALDVDGSGVVTGMAFASHGSVVGSVDFNSGFGGYVFAQRLLVPTFITDAYPELEAIFATSYAAGTGVRASFSVDTSSGQFTAVDARAGFCGPGRLDGNGDGRVGSAVIDGSLLTAADQRALVDADSRHTCAVVHTVGTIDTATGQLSLTSDITIRVAEVAPIGTAPPTDTTTAGQSAWPQSTLGYLFALLVGLSALALGLARTGRPPGGGPAGRPSLHR